MDNLRIIITGGCGFIGSNLVKKLSQYKNIDITIIDNLWRGTKKYILNIPNIKIITEDLSDKHVCLKNINNADIVYHLAEIVSGVEFAFNNEYYIFQKNITINSNVLNSCIENKIPNYIYVGSACSYPKSKQNNQGLNYFKEEDTFPLDPETSYGMSKYLGEYEALLAMKEKKINVGILRLHNIYGGFCSLDIERMQVIPSLIYKILKNNKTNETLKVWGSGKQYRDFLHVDDVINGLELIFLKGMNKGPIQIGSSNPTTIKELSEIISKINNEKYNIKTNIEFDTNRMEGDFGRISINDKAKEILNWNITINLEEGIKKTFEWINSELQII